MIGMGSGIAPGIIQARRGTERETCLYGLFIRESGSFYIKVMPSSSNKLPQAMPIINNPMRIKMFWRRRWFSLNSTKIPTPAETSKPDNIAPVPSMPSR